MQDRIRAAFDSVHAEDALKERTRRFLAGKTRNYAHGPAPAYRRLAPVLACFLFLLLGLGGYWLYFLPTSYISIDVNPSSSWASTGLTRWCPWRATTPTGKPWLRPWI